MVIDSSALLAIVLGEDEAETFEDAILGDPVRLVSAVTAFETRIVVLSRQGQDAERDYLLYASRIGLDVVPFDQEQITQACDAFWRFGKGRHPARLNFADCAAYALAKATGEPLLYKGNDFSRTDIDGVVA